jgi:hypothetical protein
MRALLVETLFAFAFLALGAAIGATYAVAVEGHSHG